MKLSRRAFASGIAGTALLGPALLRGQTPAPAALVQQPQFFNANQLETVAVIADIIIPRTDTPGARDALVHLHLDKILAASDAQTQGAFLEGLKWLDGYSSRAYSKPFPQLDPDAQVRLLREVSEGSKPELEPGKIFVGTAKRWTARIYYSTAIGYRELNKGGRVPAAYSSRTCA
jgi:hypothetical protein